MASEASMTTRPAPRLNPASIPNARAPTRTPSYDRRPLHTGIVHLGLGAFARAHLAEYTDDVLALAPEHWMVTGVNLRSTDQKSRLAPQDGLYTLLRRDDHGDQARIIGSITNVLAGAEDWPHVLTILTAKSTKIVSLTVTEKGYSHAPATGRLDTSHADIRHDTQTPTTPRSAVGVLVAALAMRHEAGLPPFSVLCCDNLPHNGALVRTLVRDFAALRDDRLAQWIERNGAFPSTMVDRIVPATTDEIVHRVEDLTGLQDAAPVAHEPFRQWVIEDQFVEGARPAWDRVGAQFVGDVAPFESMKLRMLNASHSALAYLGYLGGHETIADCVHDPAYRGYVKSLWRDEIIPVLPSPPGQDLADYATALLSRFDNRSIRHRTWQIAMDGSQKLPQRLLATARERIQRGLPVPRIALAIAAWMVFVGGRDLAGRPIDVRDPLAQSLQQRLAGAANQFEARVKSLLAEAAIFGDDLPRNDGFVRDLVAAYQMLSTRGVQPALAEALR